MNSDDKKDFDNVLDLVNEALPEDPEFGGELQVQMSDRRVVRQLADLRNLNGVSQEDVANHLGCTQSRISKIENGFDKTVALEELEAYATALNCELEIVFKRATYTLVDEVKQHAHCIKKCFDRMAELANQDEAVAKGVADFHLEALYNLATIVRQSHERLPMAPSVHGLRLRIMDKLELQALSVPQSPQFRLASENCAGASSPV